LQNDYYSRMVRRMSLSGEFYGQGDESFEQSANIRSNIDSEWAALFDEMNANSANKLQTNHEIDKIMDDLYARLNDYDLPRLIDKDESIEKKIFFDFLRREWLGKLEQLRWSPDGTQEGDRARVGIESLRAYYDQRESQAELFNCAAGLLYAETSPHEFIDDVPYLADYLQENKKQMQAEFRIQHGLDRQWIQFFEDVTPGEGLSYFQPGDEMYLTYAEDGLEAFEAARAKKWQTVERAGELVGIMDYYDPAVITAKYVDLIELYYLSKKTADSELDKANRNARMWEYGRNTDFDQETLRELIAFYEKQ